MMDNKNGFEKESDLERVSNFAVLRQKIPLTNTNKHIQAFKSMYDKLFSEFQTEVMEEYNCLQSGYGYDYESNYQANMDDKNANVDDINTKISSKNDYYHELKEEKKFDLAFLKRFFARTTRVFYQRVFFKFLGIYVTQRKAKVRVLAYSKNRIRENTIRRLYRNWYKVSHQWGKDRVDGDEDTIRINMQNERLNMWTDKVEQMVSYMAQLEDKIKQEVQARE